MDEMLSLLDDHSPCLIAEQIFLEQLPEDIRLQLADADFGNPRALAQKADVLWLAKLQMTSQVVRKVTTQKQKPQPKTSNTEGWCFYHTRYGDKAHKCKE